MKDRIHEIMEREGMTQQAFASALGISPASLSSIFTGRTNPTRNHVEAVHRTFPKINTNWLMFGEGEPYMEGERERFEQTCLELAGGDSEDGTRDNNVLNSPKTAPASTQPSVPEIRYIERPPRQITEIRIFFDDGTYETFSRKNGN